MSVQYDFYENPPQKGLNRKKLHVRAKLSATVSFQDFVRFINDTTSHSSSDVVGVLDAISEALVFELSHGRRVHLKGLGFFQLSLTAPQVNSPKEIRAESVSVKTIDFLPEAEWMSRFKSVQLERTRDKQHSLDYSEIETNRLLTAHFLDNNYITREKFSHLCGLTRATALRRLRQLINTGKLKKEGPRNSSFYIPVSGNYGR